MYRAGNRLIALACAGVLGLAACGTSPDAETASEQSDVGDWDSVLAEADGQTVNWYMYGGDDTLNGFVDGYLTDQLTELGVSLNQVKITDAAEAVNKVLGERQAGRTSDGGSVDAIWVNGENFATGVQAELWECGWTDSLPNAEFIDTEDPSINTDFGTPVDGCEAAWQRADSALVYNSEDLTSDDVSSVTSLFEWAESNPGRFTYPAPPDFTGSMAVRSILYDTIDGPDALPTEFDQGAYDEAAGELWPRLAEVAPSLWRKGETYPQSQNDVEKLYANGEISAYFTYGPGAVGGQVDDGVLPESTRETVLEGGNISNVSFLGVPANAGNRAGAVVLANLLQAPDTQLELYRATGIYPAIDLATTPEQTQAAFADVPVSPSVLPLDTLTANSQPELSSEYVEALEAGWKQEVLQQ